MVRKEQSCEFLDSQKGQDAITSIPAISTIKPDVRCHAKNSEECPKKGEWAITPVCWRIRKVGKGR